MEADKKNDRRLVPPARIAFGTLLFALACSILTGAAQMTLQWTAIRLWETHLLEPEVLGSGLLAHLILGMGLFFHPLALRRSDLPTIYPVLVT